MMRVTIENAESTEAWAKAMRGNSDIVREAMTVAGTETATEIQDRSRADIASAGRFGPAWTDSLNSTVEENDDGVAVVTTMEGPKWRLFEEGGVQQGQPLLWLPLSFSDAKGIRARDYPGELVRVDRAGKSPLLVAPGDGPKYVGLASVTIPKKFHLTEISQAVGAEIGARYAEAFKGLSDG